jgi:hypothetical protein
MKSTIYSRHSEKSINDWFLKGVTEAAFKEPLSTTGLNPVIQSFPYRVTGLLTGLFSERKRASKQGGTIGAFFPTQSQNLRTY